MMDISNSKGRSSDALDLRPALELRAESEHLIERLSAGECGDELLGRAQALLDRESELVDAAESALAAYGAADTLPPRTREAVYEVLAPLATGQLGAFVDWAEAKPVAL